MFADYARAAQEISVDVVRSLLGLATGDPVLDHWEAEVVFTWLVDATLAWLERGDPDRDEEFVERTTAGLRALRGAWAG
jgi:hypothetical protein